MKKSDEERKSHRLLILITKGEYANLTKLAQERKQSRAEVIRTAIACFVDGARDPDDSEPLLAPEYSDTGYPPSENGSCKDKPSKLELAPDGSETKKNELKRENENQ